VPSCVSTSVPDFPNLFVRGSLRILLNVQLCAFPGRATPGGSSCPLD